MVSTILTSLVVSLIVSLVTFTMGLRAGKNQADRPKLKDIYRKLSVHFVDLQEGLIKGSLKQWEDYPEHNYQHYPIVAEMVMDGSLIDLSPDLATTLDKLEKEMLRFGYEYRETSKEMSIFTLEYLKQYVSEPTEESKFVIKYGISKSSVGIELGHLFIDQWRKDMISWFEKDKHLGINLGKISKDGCEKEVYVYPDALSISMGDFISKLSLIMQEQSAVNELLNTRKLLLSQADDIIKILKKRTVDPHPFWQTVLMAFRDIFRK
jgi:hypothetical protein